MQVHGEWFLCDDGVVQPVIHGEILAGNGSWVLAPFLMDTGADRTVFSVTILAALRLRPLIRQEHLSGLGDTAASVLIETQVHCNHEAGGTVTFRSQYAAIIVLEALELGFCARRSPRGVSTGTTPGKGAEASGRVCPQAGNTRRV